jgi:predicted membrane protein
METTDKVSERFSSPRSGKSLAGVVLVTIGGVLLARELGFDIPSWVLSWETLIIGLGLFFGARRMFRPGPWMIMVFVGAAFLIDEYYHDLSFHQYIWPMAIILVGVWMILKPRRKREWKFDVSDTSDNTIDINTVFGGTKKLIVSKDFKGGEINTVFGGNDIDFSQADFNGTAALEVNVVFGGVKLIVPPHWKIQSDVTAAFGSVEDKRRESGQVSDNKTLVLKGSVAFGGIEIKSY